MPQSIEFDAARAVRGKAPGDQYSDSLDEALKRGDEVAVIQQNPLDSEECRNELRQLLNWYYQERDRQAANRMEMAIEADCYDNDQWNADDAAEVRSRGQMPLVYNEVAPMCDWMIGTERRSRVDWKVLPRTEDDVQIAAVKTDVLKYVSDINRVVFNRSRAFADSIKVGVGWVDDGARADPTKDILYSRYEDWRNVLWDSAGSYDLDLDDGRYLFRWRWVDEDIALMMFPGREEAIRRACEDRANAWDDLDEESLDTGATNGQIDRTGVMRAFGAGIAIDSQRRRLKIIECQYRKPVKVQVVDGGPFKGQVFHKADKVLVESVIATQSPIVDRMTMRMHVAVFTEGDMLAKGVSAYRHNKFSLTPIFCYRRGRDRLPYGAIRRVRDVQMDLNKRASKALFMLNTNQIIADSNAVEDWDEARDEADRPDGIIKKKVGSEFTIRRDTDAATGQLQMMTMAAQSIQKSGGVNNENMGRQSNAISGEAIKARQIQGSVATTEPFDNLRFAIQAQGEKQLSLTEQFYTDEKVIRLTGTKGALNWLKVNQPEVQADGSVRFINDITASQADFIVVEQDYAGTLRQVMFDALNGIAQKYPPEVALRLMTIAMEFSDLPNKDEIADQIRKITGERDPSKDPSPEEQQQMAQQQELQAESMQLQRQTAMAALEEQRAKVRELNAKAAKLEAEAASMGAGAGGDPAAQDQMQRALMQVQAEAANQIDVLTQQLAKSQSDAASKTLQIKTDADTKVECARIEADSKQRVAEIQAASDRRLALIEEALQGIEKMVNKDKPESGGGKGE